MEAWEALEAAGRAGWAELWPDAPGGPCAMLSALSAGRLGLALSSDGSRWLRDGEADPTSIDGAMVVHVETDVSSPEGPGRFTEMADPDATRGLKAMAGIEDAERRAETYMADVAAEEAEDAAHLATLKSKRRPRSSLGEILGRMEAGEFAPRAAPTIPRPTLLLGINRPWPLYSTTAGARDRHAHDGPCPECGGRQLPIAAACLVCLRSGVDHLLSRGETVPDEAEARDVAPARGITVPERFRSIAEWLE